MNKKDNILTGGLEGIEHEEITLRPNRQTSSENDNVAYWFLTTTRVFYSCFKLVAPAKRIQPLIQGSKVGTANWIYLDLSTNFIDQNCDWDGVSSM
jgi:hypothetical protein